MAASRVQLLIATTNPAKAAKLRWLVRGLGFRLVSSGELPRPVAVEERGATCSENAAFKAIEWSKPFGGLAIATDGGARIPALGDQWDPVSTRRAAGANVDDQARIRHLLGLLAGLTGEQRQARWVEALAIAHSGQLLAEWEVEGNDGYLLEAFDGELPSHSFWLYHLWYYPQIGKAHAQLTERELEKIDTVWARLRQEAQVFLKRWLKEASHESGSQKSVR